MDIKIKKVRDNAVIPTYGTEFSAGFDLYACLDEDVVLNSFETKLIPLGIALEIPTGHAGFIYARSGLATKAGLAPANKVAVIDCDYRGEVLASMYNQSQEVRVIKNGDRIAQMVIQPYLKVNFIETDELTDTIRGEGGFGSTGSN